jgi:hypothetical protein
MSGADVSGCDSMSQLAHDPYTADSDFAFHASI